VAAEFEDFSTLKMEEIGSSETSVHTRSTQHHNPEDGILHSQSCENLKTISLSKGFLRGVKMKIG
jgi:hypothetical protein